MTFRSLDNPKDTSRQPEVTVPETVNEEVNENVPETEEGMIENNAATDKESGLSEVSSVARSTTITPRKKNTPKKRSPKSNYTKNPRSAKKNRVISRSTVSSSESESE